MTDTSLLQSRMSIEAGAQSVPGSPIRPRGLIRSTPSALVVWVSSLSSLLYVLRGTQHSALCPAHSALSSVQAIFAPAKHELLVAGAGAAAISVQTDDREIGSEMHLA